MPPSSQCHRIGFGFTLINLVRNGSVAPGTTLHASSAGSAPGPLDAPHQDLVTVTAVPLASNPQLVFPIVPLPTNPEVVMAPVVPLHPAIADEKA